MNEHRALLRPPMAAVLSVNGKFLTAALMGCLAWAVWPTSPQWWPIAILSVALGIVALRSLIEASTLIARIYRRERRIAAMLAQGRTQRPADLATARTLRQARMTDD